MSNNLIAKWPEFDRFVSEALAFCCELVPLSRSQTDTARSVRNGMQQKDLAKLEELLFVGNPLWETHTKAEDFRHNVAGRLPWLKKLDGVPIDDDEKEKGKALVG